MLQFTLIYRLDSAFQYIKKLIKTVSFILPVLFSFYLNIQCILFGALIFT